MTIIVDTNILISTLMNPKSEIGSLLINGLHRHKKLTCYTLYVELFDKKHKILKYTKISEKLLLELLFLVLKRIDFINEHQISKISWLKAKELALDIDVKDINFVALTIESNGMLWTGDKKLYNELKKKGFNQVVNLDDLKRLIQ